MDPDPAIFVPDLQDANKTCTILLEDGRILTSDIRIRIQMAQKHPDTDPQH